MPIAFSHGYADRMTEYRLRGFPLITIGRFSYVNEFARIHYFIETSAIRIGNFCSIAAGVGFFQRESHHPEWLTTSPAEVFPFAPGAARPTNPEAQRNADIEIGNDVWIGDGARILPGLRIGDGAVIGAAAVVTKDVPPYAVYVGNPGRVVRHRFAPPDVAFLLASRWWDLPTATLRRLAPVICSTDIAALRRALDALTAAERTPAAAARAVVAIKRKQWQPQHRRAKLRRSLAKRVAFVRGLFGAKP